MKALTILKRTLWYITKPYGEHDPHCACGRCEALAFVFGACTIGLLLVCLWALINVPN